VRSGEQNAEFDKGVIKAMNIEIQKAIIIKAKDYTVTLNGTIVTVDHAGEQRTEPYQNGPFRVDKLGSWGIVDRPDNINPWAIIADLMRELAK
jgi:hypothetical protein